MPPLSGGVVVFSGEWMAGGTSEQVLLSLLGQALLPITWAGHGSQSFGTDGVHQGTGIERMQQPHLLPNSGFDFFDDSGQMT